MLGILQRGSASGWELAVFVEPARNAIASSISLVYRCLLPASLRGLRGQGLMLLLVEFPLSPFTRCCTPRKSQTSGLLSPPDMTMQSTSRVPFPISHGPHGENQPPPHPVRLPQRPSRLLARPYLKEKSGLHHVRNVSPNFGAIIVFVSARRAFQHWHPLAFRRALSSL